MKPALLLALVFILPLAAEAAEDELGWQYDGHAQLHAAAAEAKRTGKRLLVGLAGSPT